MMTVNMYYGTQKVHQVSVRLSPEVGHLDSACVVYSFKRYILVLV